MDTSEFAVREHLPGQKDSDLFEVRCKSDVCGTNHHILNKRGTSGGRMLLGRYYSGSAGIVKCPRCHSINDFQVSETGNVTYKP